MIEGKAEALQNWLKTWSGIDQYLKLNATTNEVGDKAVNVIYNDRVVAEYINGTALRDYTFELVLVADWSDGFDSINEEAMSFGERWADWVNEQFRAGNMPDFGDTATITKIESTYNTPSVALVYPDSKTARYSFQARIEYRE